MVALAVPISSYRWSTHHQQLSNKRRYSGFGLSFLKGERARQFGVRKRGVLLVSAAKSKKWQWDVWEQKEVTLDDSDLMLLEMRRKLGESKDDSLAKVVAKKLIPYATNLEVDKIVKQKGVKPFLELVKVEEVKQTKVSGARGNEPGLRSPRPRFDVEGLQPPPRRPGDARPPPAENYYEWPDEADDVLQRFQRPVSNERELNARRRFTEDMIQLSPKPRGGADSKPSSYSPVASEDSGIPGFRGDKTKSLITKPPSPPKPVPELNSRPGRGVDVEVFASPAPVVRPPRDLPVPSLNMRPEVRLSVSAEPEDQPGVSEREVRPRRDLPVPSLSMRPEVQPSDLTLVEETEKQPSISARVVPVPSLNLKPEVPVLARTGVEEQPAVSTTRREVPVPSLSMKPEAPLATPTPSVAEEQPAVSTTQREFLVPSLSIKPEARLVTPTPPAKPEDQPATRREVPVPNLNLKPEVPQGTPTEVAEPVEVPTAKREVPVPSLAMKPEATPTPPALVAEPDEQLEVSSTVAPSGAKAIPENEKFLSGENEEASLPVLSKPPVKESLQTGYISEHPQEPEQVSGKAELVSPVLSNPPRVPETNDLANVQAINQSEDEKAKVPYQEKAMPELNKPPAKAIDIESSRVESEQLVTSAVNKEVLLSPPPSGVKAVISDKETSSKLNTTQDSPKPQKTQASPASQEEIDRDWALAEAAVESKEIQEVVFIGSNAGGMIARFGCLNGFLPGRDLLETRGLKTFRSWARERGYDVNHTSVWDSSDGAESTFSASKLSSQGLEKDAETHSLHPACEVDINKLYKEYRISLLSSLVGERANVTITLVDRTMKKLVFSERKAVLVNPDVALKRAELMAKLKVGDVIKGRVRNISLFGVFVELVQDVTGLIHFSELSWTPVSDPAELITVGQELEVMVLKLDQDRQRINLSLKRMTSDPLLESVESMLAREASPEVPAVPEFDELIRKLESREEIRSAVKGRCVDGAAFVPSFQVYLSSTLPEGYKLLARFENHLQEVLLETSINRDALISIIQELTSTEVVEEQV